MALNERQKRFCLEYIKDFNGSTAIKDSGYESKNSNRTAFQLLSNIDVQGFLKVLLEEVAVELKKQERVALWTAEEVWAEIQAIAAADTREAFDENNKPKSIHDMPLGLRKCIKSLDVYEDFTEGVPVGQTTKITFWDKGKSLEMLGRIHQLFVERKEVHNTHSLDFARTVSEKPIEELVAMANDRMKKLK